MRSQWVKTRELEHVLAALTPANRLVCEIALHTGLRVGDVLLLRREQVAKRMFSIQEQKTGKWRRVYLTNDLRQRCAELGGAVYVFPNRLNGRRPRTRQAVWKDLKRAAGLFRMPPGVSPHSLRKAYAVELRERGLSVAQIARELNHTDPAVTMLYAMADQLTARHKLC